MNTSNRKNAGFFSLMYAMGAILPGLALPLVSHAEAWELRTAIKEVPGTREIEFGNPERAIRKAKKHLDKIDRKKLYLESVARRDRAEVLNNLCIGYITVQDFAQAEHYCDLAVEAPDEAAVSHNNRGVLKALQGDFLSAQRDFTFAWDAGCSKPCDKTDQTTLEPSHLAARRNLERTESQILASE